jgi:hypothetical protein
LRLPFAEIESPTVVLYIVAAEAVT